MHCHYLVRILYVRTDERLDPSKSTRSQRPCAASDLPLLGLRVRWFHFSLFFPIKKKTRTLSLEIKKNMTKENVSLTFSSN